MYSDPNLIIHSEYSYFEEHYIQFIWSYNQADSADCTTELSGDPQGFFTHVMTPIQGKFSTLAFSRLRAFDSARKKGLH